MHIVCCVTSWCYWVIIKQWLLLKVKGLVFTHISLQLDHWLWNRVVRHPTTPHIRIQVDFRYTTTCRPCPRAPRRCLPHACRPVMVADIGAVLSPSWERYAVGYAMLPTLWLSNLSSSSHKITVVTQVTFDRTFLVIEIIFGIIAWFSIDLMLNMWSTTVSTN